MDTRGMFLGVTSTKGAKEIYDGNQMKNLHLEKIMGDMDCVIGK